MSTNNIDIKHPFWIELKRLIRDTHTGLLTTKNWYLYVKNFTRDHMIKFLEVCTDVQICKISVVSELILNESGHERKKLDGSSVDIFTRLDELVELWHYDYSEFDCIGIVVDNFSEAGDEDYKLIKYFLDHGSQLNQHHGKAAFYLSNDAVNLLLDRGLDPNEMLSCIVQDMRDDNENIFEKLRLFAKLNLDITGHFLEDIPKKIYSFADDESDMFFTDEEDDEAEAYPLGDSENDEGVDYEAVADDE
jgi:hypothetical protein